MTPDAFAPDFAAALSAATTQESAFAALHALSEATVPVRLWTVMTVDMEAGLARRAFSNMAQAYPTSGTKPVTRNAWFDIVHGRHESFVANSIEEIAAVFPDHETIAALGCASCLNLPVVVAGKLAATVNMLDAGGHFTPERVAEVQATLACPPSPPFWPPARSATPDCGGPDRGGPSRRGHPAGVTSRAERRPEDTLLPSRGFPGDCARQVPVREDRATILTRRRP